MAQSVECPTLGSGSGSDLRVKRSTVDLSGDSAWDSPSFAPPSPALSLSS